MPCRGSRRLIHGRMTKQTQSTQQLRDDARLDLQFRFCSISRATLHVVRDKKRKIQRENMSDVNARVEREVFSVRMKSLREILTV